MTSHVLLDVADHSIYFKNEEKKYSILKDITFSLKRGELLGIVGESGCGKSMLGQSLIGMYPAGVVETTGSIRFDGVNLLDMPAKKRNKYRGKKISMVFQNPNTSLNPVISIGKQMTDVIRQHKQVNKKDAANEALNWLKEVGISNPEDVLVSYPHQLSGGMKQRVVIAMALSCHAELIIADEPTTALDVTTQFQILRLIQRLQKEHNVSFIVVTHDMGVASLICDRVMVMYAGKIIEMGHVNEVLHSPQHPYTKGLLQCLPGKGKRMEDLYTIPGTVPSPVSFASGCRFFGRCTHARPECENQVPEWKPSKAGSDHGFACFYPDERSDSTS